MDYKWNIKQKYNGNLFDVIKNEYNFSDEQLHDFINIDESKYRNPNILPNINEAVTRVKKAIDNKEHILVAGDYDTDGITSTSILIMGLSYLGGIVDWRLPQRSEGYGLNTIMVDEAIKKNVSLIITVDNGIAAHKAIKYAQDNNIDVVVTDHHQFLSDELPCDIVVDPFIQPDYPFKGICGCMVAYKFLRVLIPDLPKLDIHKEIVALTTIATIGDVMPLLDENRKFVYNGLKIINGASTNNFGLDALINELAMEMGTINSIDIAFKIVPCINALGRMGSPNIGVELFLADDAVIADKLAKTAVSLNNKRKYIQNKVLKETIVDDSQPFIMQIFDNLPAGILGIIAGRLSSKYHRPCFAMYRNNGYVGGSGRSIEGYDISKCISENFDIVNGGGHMGACGVNMKEENLAEFVKRCNTNFVNWAETAEKTNELSIDVLTELPLNAINDDLMNYLAKLSPFGEQNREPQFCSLNVDVFDYKILGKLQNTVKFTFEQNGTFLEGICFNEVKDKYIDELSAPDKVDILYTLSYNYWNGRKTIQLMINDIKKK